LHHKESSGAWIAGTSLQVIDLQTDEVMAERIEYWTYSGASSKNQVRRCPPYEEPQKFIERVLKPSPR
jgi:hypothetical protein